MDDKECIEKMLRLHEQYREQYAEDIENPESRRGYFWILSDKSSPNKSELYNKKSNLYFLKRIKNLEKEFSDSFSEGIRDELSEIWRGSIIFLLTGDKTIGSEFRDFVDIEGRIRSESMGIEISESLDRKIEDLEFEIWKLKNQKNKVKKENK